MKTKEELEALKEELETLNKKLAELSEAELAQVAGGADRGLGTDNCPFCGEFMSFSGSRFKRDFFHCKNCGDLTYFKDGNRWEHGHITD